MTASHAARRGQRTASDAGLDLVEDALGPRRIATPNYPPRVEVAMAAHHLGQQLAALRVEQAVREHGGRALLAQTRATFRAGR